MISETIIASRFIVFNDSLKCTCMYCINSSMCHFKFPKVVLTHILDEVGIFCIVVLLSVSSWVCLPIFIQISSCLTDTEQKNNVGTIFLRHSV